MRNGKMDICPYTYIHIYIYRYYLHTYLFGHKIYDSQPPAAAAAVGHIMRISICIRIRIQRAEIQMNGPF